MPTQLVRKVSRLVPRTRKAQPTEYLDVIKSVNEQTGFVGCGALADRGSLNDSADISVPRDIEK